MDFYIVLADISAALIVYLLPALLDLFILAFFLNLKKKGKLLKAVLVANLLSIIGKKVFSHLEEMFKVGIIDTTNIYSSPFLIFTSTYFVILNVMFAAGLRIFIYRKMLKGKSMMDISATVLLSSMLYLLFRDLIIILVTYLCYTFGAECKVI